MSSCVGEMNSGVWLVTLGTAIGSYCMTEREFPWRSFIFVSDELNSR